jgi:hypothetical protein
VEAARKLGLEGSSGQAEMAGDDEPAKSVVDEWRPRWIADAQPFEYDSEGSIALGTEADLASFGEPDTPDGLVEEGDEVSCDENGYGAEFSSIEDEIDQPLETEGNPEGYRETDMADGFVEVNDDVSCDDDDYGPVFSSIEDDPDQPLNEYASDTDLEQDEPESQFAPVTDGEHLGYDELPLATASAADAGFEQNVQGVGRV